VCRILTDIWKQAYQITQKKQGPSRKKAQLVHIAYMNKKTKSGETNPSFAERYLPLDYESRNPSWVPHALESPCRRDPDTVGQPDHLAQLPGL
jgi:hypothetical protein